MLSITDIAIEKIKEISNAEGIGYYSIRVKIIGGGCAGYSYDIHFDDLPTDLDETLTKDGVTVMIDPLSFQYMENIEIDYIDSVLGGAFKINNPEVKNTCGCGSSVSF